MKYELYEIDEFSIKYPADWEIKENFMDVKVGFISPMESEDDAFQENVSVDFEFLPETVTLYQFIKANIQKLSKSFTEFSALIPMKKKTIAKQEGYTFTYNISTKGLLLKLQSFWAVKDFRVFYITYTALSGHFLKYIKIIKKMVKSLNIL